MPKPVPPKLLPDTFSTRHILVVGDVMLDRYWYGATSRISPEAPVPVVHIKDVEERLGGAGNVAVNIASLGGHARLWGLVGNDDAAATIRQLLDAYAVTSLLHTVAGANTVTKLRVMSRHQQLIRLDFEDGFGDSRNTAAAALPTTALADIDAIVVSDYGKGAVGDLSPLMTAAARHAIPVLVDPKGADFERYRGARCVTPNLAEFETVVGECHDLDDVATRATRLCVAYDLGTLVITLGEQGMIRVDGEGYSHHLSARARDVFDVTGAGDTVIASLAVAAAAGWSWDEAMSLANQAAG